MRILFTNLHQDNGGGHDTDISTLAQSLATRHNLFVDCPQTFDL